MSDPGTMFHGGPAGRRPGEWILPPSITGATSTRDIAEQHGLDGADVVRRDRVFVTPNAFAAAMFAAGHGPGAQVYRVLPDAPLEHDPDCDLPGLSWQAPRALVVGVHLTLTAEEVASIMGAIA